MAERVVTTEAIMVAERPGGEASKVLTLFTRELGLVHAFARSVREVRSKLRYNLNLYSTARVTLVPGREYWKLIGVMESGTPVAPEICLLVDRFLGLHDPHPEIFDTIIAGGDVEVTTLVVLDKLGYVGAASASNGAERRKLIERAVYASHL